MSGKPRPQARVRVRLVLELDADGVWGSDCTVGQAWKQGLDSVEKALRSGLVINGLTCEGTKKTTARVIGEPKLVVTIIEDEQ